MRRMGLTLKYDIIGFKAPRQADDVNSHQDLGAFVQRSHGRVEAKDLKKI